ncbi:murein L,D-transpeptidase [Tritonibacter multivorans]|uniref:Murein L,D-transpeptidase n=1 Tax=Tritonibacter multivorans TaxID=928856 RepID=A0A0N7M161_9RHOB|nr:L,D-transpeptidase family protein [Tritonibacter multivorans]MDA7421454.1 L,D-transpeptidase family protein [Tritonibacter multivorans]CUH82369.1 murein L,D-transpeptidase [Tritonibacter multivorans]SFC99429.1 Murein L,D-transpeptidase YcbB/YkuD [Tritonibacter multivorans]
MPMTRLLPDLKFLQIGGLALALGLTAPIAATAQDSAAVSSAGFRQAIAEMAWEDEAVAGFYRSNGFQPLWTGADAAAAQRRSALLQALSEAAHHGLPDMTAQANALLDQMRNVQSTRDLGEVEVALSRALVDYARDIQTGLLVPSRIDEGMVRKKRKIDSAALLAGMETDRPFAYMQSLVPQSQQYRALMREKLRLEATMTAGGWGQSVPESKLEVGAKGAKVVALRNRLVAMGYLGRSLSNEFDDKLQDAVRQFQEDHGLNVDGVAGTGTIREINRTAEDRLKSVLVAMERERWLTPERGERHVLVNQTDFTAKIVDQGEVTFVTRSVIGKHTSDRRTPEFSDTMEHMVINPSWYVPRSIVTKEYLPKLKNNPHAHSYIEITDNRGRVVNRDAVDFTQFTARSFPFAMRQPPSSRNALGLVKFMFPNKYNIYLHDTPAKNLFSREVRAYSHGCIRLAQPFEFAYALLAKQSEDPKAFFDRTLNSGRETKVNLEKNVPVHIIYRTAFIDETGTPQFRRDVYGRDAKVWEALERAGVALPGFQS